MAQGDQLPAVSSGNSDPAQAALEAVSGSLARRGYLTTEWWTTMIGGALSAVLALVHINASSATHVVAVIAPALLAGLYAVTRTMHKSVLSSALGAVFPQASGGTVAPPSDVQQAAPAADGQPVQIPDQGTAGAVVRTDPDFVFEGIPPIEEVDG